MSETLRRIDLKRERTSGLKYLNLNEVLPITAEDDLPTDWQCGFYAVEEEEHEDEFFEIVRGSSV